MEQRIFSANRFGCLERRLQFFFLGGAELQRVGRRQRPRHLGQHPRLWVPANCQFGEAEDAASFWQCVWPVLQATERAAKTAEAQTNVFRSDGLTKMMKVEVWKPASREEELRTWKDWQFQLVTWLVAHDSKYATTATGNPNFLYLDPVGFMMMSSVQATAVTTIKVLVNFDIQIPSNYTPKLTNSRAHGKDTKHPKALQHVMPSQYLDPGQVGIRDRPLTQEERATITRPAEEAIHHEDEETSTDGWQPQARAKGHKKNESVNEAERETGTDLKTGDRSDTPFSP